MQWCQAVTFKVFNAIQGSTWMAKCNQLTPLSFKGLTMHGANLWWNRCARCRSRQRRHPGCPVLRENHRVSVYRPKLVLLSQTRACPSASMYRPGCVHERVNSTPSPGWGPRGQGPSKNRQGPGKNNWTVHVFKKSKKTKWQLCVVCSMESGADGWVTLTLIPAVTRLTA